MLAVDTNVLVYAHYREPPERSALELLRSLAAGLATWAIALLAAQVIDIAILAHDDGDDAPATRMFSIGGRG